MSPFANYPPAGYPPAGPALADRDRPVSPWASRRPIDAPLPPPPLPAPALPPPPSAVHESPRPPSHQPPYRHLIEQMQEGAITLAVDGTILYANRRVGELLGMAPALVAGQVFGRFVTAQDRPIWRRLLAQARRTGGRTELTLDRTDGVPVPIFASFTPFTPDGAPPGMARAEDAMLCGVLTDLTRHKLLLRAADATNARLREVMAERAQAQEALNLAQKMQAIGHLTGGIAHDFNNTLQGVSSGIELMRRRLVQNRPADALRFLDAVLAGIDRAATLTRRLLAFSLRQTLLPQPVDSAALLRDIAPLLQEAVGPGIRVVMMPDDTAPPILCDRAQLEGALLNLALNARDAMQPALGGTLTLAIEAQRLEAAQLRGFGGARAGLFVRITVADTGCGMTEDVLARAFDPFFTTKPPGEGAGLGLSQVWGFIAQSGGVLRAISAPGQGAILHLHLPSATAVTTASTDTRDLAAAEPDPPPLPKRPAGRPPRALLVDDEAAVRTALAEALTDLGWRVDQAANGAEALGHLRNHRAPDILVADIGLPGGMNGRQLAEAGRALHPALPILLITGYAGAALGPDAPLPPGAQLLHKPFTLGVLAGRVQALVPRRD